MPYTINFVNNNPDITWPFVTFVQDPNSPANLNAYGGKNQETPINNGKSYNLESTNIDNTISMDAANWQGHMYLSDAPLVLPTVGGLPVDPDYTNTADPTRYQYIEFAGNLAQASTDLTYINWYSIPLQIQSESGTRGAPTSPAALDAMLTTLADLSGNNSTTVVKNNAGQIVRVISPNAGASWMSLYPTFTDYIASAFKDGVGNMSLYNLYDGINNPPSPDYQQQTYQSTSVTYTGDTYPKDLVIKGTTNVLGDFTMTATMGFSLAFSNVIYYAVMSYAWQYSGNGGGSNANGNTGDNNVFSAISRDLLAGFAFGFIGSTQWGSQPSSAWMTASDTGVFSAIQPANPYYNPWANAINTCFPDVYGFPFNDFLGGNFAPTLITNLGDTLTVTLLKP